MDSKRTIDQLLAVVRANPNDLAPRLELAALYATARDLPNALATYEDVAGCFARQGLPMKAIALYKHICSLVAAEAPHLRRRYAHVPPILSDLFEQLGLRDKAIEALDALAADSRQKPS